MCVILCLTKYRAHLILLLLTHRIHVFNTSSIYIDIVHHKRNYAKQQQQQQQQSHITLYLEVTFVMCMLSFYIYVVLFQDDATANATATGADCWFGLVWLGLLLLLLLFLMMVRQPQVHHSVACVV